MSQKFGVITHKKIGEDRFENEKSPFLRNHNLKLLNVQKNTRGRWPLTPANFGLEQHV